LQSVVRELGEAAGAGPADAVQEDVGRARLGECVGHDAFGLAARRRVERMGSRANAVAATGGGNLRTGGVERFAPAREQNDARTTRREALGTSQAYALRRTDDEYRRAFDLQA
jgi:hypothetical protein